MRLWALTPISAARGVAELVARLPLAVLELVVGDGTTAVLRQGRQPTASAVVTDADRGARFTRDAKSTRDAQG